MHRLFTFTHKILAIAAVSGLAACVSSGGKTEIGETALGFVAKGAGSGRIATSTLEGFTTRQVALVDEPAEAIKPIAAMPNKTATLTGYMLVPTAEEGELGETRSRALVGNMTLQANFDAAGTGGSVNTRVTDIAEYDFDVTLKSEATTDGGVTTTEETFDRVDVTETPGSIFTGGALSGNGDIDGSEFSSTLAGVVNSSEGDLNVDAMINGEFGQYQSALIAAGGVEGTFTDRTSETQGFVGGFVTSE